MDYQFDLGRILFGDLPLMFYIEIAFRTIAMFAYLLFMLRLVGHRGTGQLSLFEFAMIIALGSAVGDPMFYPDVPLVHGLVVITLVVVLQRLVVAVTNRHRAVEKVIEGRAYRVVVDGRIDMHEVKHALLSRAEVLMELRQEEVENLGEVRRAYFETDGMMSVFRYPKEEAKAGLSTLPDHESYTHPFPAGTNVPETGLYACYDCGDVKTYDKDTRFEVCPSCGASIWLAAVESVNKEVEHSHHARNPVHRG